MSLNCLCNALDRRDSACRDRKRRLEQHQEKRHLMVKRVARNWSGNLIPSGFLQTHASDVQDDSMMGQVAKKARKGHRRGRSLVNEPLFGQGEPRLLRSSGMRRDWSFEDLRNIVNNFSDKDHEIK